MNETQAMRVRCIAMHIVVRESNGEDWLASVLRAYGRDRARMIARGVAMAREVWDGSRPLADLGLALADLGKRSEYCAIAEPAIVDIDCGVPIYPPPGSWLACLACGIHQSAFDPATHRCENCGQGSFRVLGDIQHPF